MKVLLQYRGVRRHAQKLVMFCYMKSIFIVRAGLNVIAIVCNLTEEGAMNLQSFEADCCRMMISLLDVPMEGLHCSNGVSRSWKLIY